MTDSFLINPPEAYCKCGTLCFVYPPDGSQGVCPDHCPEHDYEFEDGCGWTCKTCGVEPPNDWFDESGPE